MKMKTWSFFSLSSKWNVNMVIWIGTETLRRQHWIVWVNKYCTKIFTWLILTWYVKLLDIIGKKLIYQKSLWKAISLTLNPSCMADANFWQLCIDISTMSSFSVLASKWINSKKIAWAWLDLVFLLWSSLSEQLGCFQTCAK